MEIQFKENDDFNNYIDEYKKLSLSAKKQLVENEMQELLLVLNKLNEKYNNSVDTLFNREVLDLKKEDSTYDDFVEAIFVYIYSIKEQLASLIDRIDN